MAGGGSIKRIIPAFSKHLFKKMNEDLENHRNEVYLCGKVFKGEGMFFLVVILVLLALAMLLFFFSVRVWKSNRAKKEHQVKKDEDNLFDMLFRFISG